MGKISSSQNHFSTSTQSHFTTKNNTRVIAQKGGLAILPCVVKLNSPATVSKQTQTFPYNSKFKLKYKKLKFYSLKLFAFRFLSFPFGISVMMSTSKILIFQKTI